MKKKMSKSLKAGILGMAVIAASVGVLPGCAMTIGDFIGTGSSNQSNTTPNTVTTISPGKYTVQNPSGSLQPTYINLPTGDVYKWDNTKGLTSKEDIFKDKIGQADFVNKDKMTYAGIKSNIEQELATKAPGFNPSDLEGDLLKQWTYKELVDGLYNTLPAASTIINSQLKVAVGGEITVGESTGSNKWTVSLTKVGGVGEGITEASGLVIENVGTGYSIRKGSVDYSSEVKIKDVDFKVYYSPSYSNGVLSVLLTYKLSRNQTNAFTTVLQFRV